MIYSITKDLIKAEQAVASYFITHTKNTYGATIVALPLYATASALITTAILISSLVSALFSEDSWETLKGIAVLGILTAGFVIAPIGCSIVFGSFCFGVFIANITYSKEWCDTR